MFLPALLLVLAVLAAACGGNGGGTTTEDPAATPADSPADTGTDEGEGDDVAGECPSTVKIAYQGPLTGDNAALGINMLRGVQLAISELNEGGEFDYQIEVVQLDSQGSPDQAPPLAQQAAADEEILAVVGPAFSGETAASGPIYEQAGLPFVSPSATNPDLAENGWTNFFRTVATDATQGPVAAQFIADNLGAENVAVIDDSSEYGKGLADIVESSLEERGATVVFRDAIEAGQQDYSAVVGQVVQSGADAVFFGGYFPEAGLIRRQLVDQGGQDITFVSDDGAFDNTLVEVAGQQAAEGVYVTFPGADPSSAPQEFLDRYDEEFSAAPGAFTIEAYINTLLIAEGLRDGACTREAMRDFLDNFSGEIFGQQIEFADDGNIAAQSFFIYQVEDGAFVQKEQVVADDAE
jgi:branched-chain amino acid transport system substrate-binding protein